MPKHPCTKDCPGRDERCHVTCERWKQYESEKFDEIQKKRAEWSVNEYLYKSEFRNNHDIPRQKRWKRSYEKNQ